MLKDRTIPLEKATSFSQDKKKKNSRTWNACRA